LTNNTSLTKLINFIVFNFINLTCLRAKINHLFVIDFNHITSLLNNITNNFFAANLYHVTSFRNNIIHLLISCPHRLVSLWTYIIILLIWHSHHRASLRTSIINLIHFIHSFQLSFLTLIDISTYSCQKATITHIFKLTLIYSHHKTSLRILIINYLDILLLYYNKTSLRCF
jgi:hypothetical protein